MGQKNSEYGRFSRSASAKWILAIVILKQASNLKTKRYYLTKFKFKISQKTTG